MSNFSKTFCTKSPLKVHVPGHVAQDTTGNDAFYKGKGGQDMFNRFSKGEYNPSDWKAFKPKGSGGDKPRANDPKNKQKAAMDAIKNFMGQKVSVDSSQTWFSPGTKKGPVLKHCK